jgi:hypothetical protein
MTQQLPIDHMNPASQAESLSRQIRQLLGPIQTAAPFLEGWPELKALRTTRPRSLPVVALLDRLITHSVPATADLVQALAAAADDLEWRQTYSAADFGPAFLDRYGWTELIGLRGPIPSTEVACGFLALGPEIDYPSHAHEAEELYLPLAGDALWMRGDEDFTTRLPGLPIHHPSWMPHAMRTRAEPLLALYIWRGGDLAAKSNIIGRS